MAILQQFGTSTGGLNYVAAVQQLCLIVALYYDRRDLAEQLLEGQGEILLWEHRPASWPPSACLVRQGKRYFLVLTGTQNINPQVIGHLKGTFLRSKLPDMTTLVNGQWAGVWDDVWAEVRPLITDPLNEVWLGLSGHSYGGAVATLGAFELQATVALNGSSVITFGAPRSVASGYTGIVPSIFNVWSTLDAVPHLPPDLLDWAFVSRWATPLRWLQLLRSWDHYGDNINLNAAGGDSVLAPNPDPLPDFVSVGPQAEHSTINYFGRLAQHFSGSGVPPEATFALRLTFLAIQGQPVQPVIESLPRVIRGPDGEPEVIPIYDGIAVTPSFGVPQVAPTYLGGGTPMRLIRQMQNGPDSWNETHIVYCPTTDITLAFAQCKQTAAALNRARVKALSAGAKIVSTRISVDDQRGVGDPFDSPPYGAMSGKRPAPYAQTKVAWFFSTRDATFTVRGRPMYRGWNRDDSSLADDTPTRQDLSPKPSIVTMALAFQRILVTGFENSDSLPGRGAFRTTVRDESQNPFRDALDIGVESHGYLTFVTADELQVGAPIVSPRAVRAGDRVQLKVSRGTCAVGIQGTWLVASVAPVTGGFQYVLCHRPCCTPENFVCTTFQARGVTKAYLAMAAFEADTLTTRDTKGNGSSGGRGRRSARCR